MEAARKAISSPLLEGASLNGARGVIINVTGGIDLSLVEVSEASSIVQEAADEDANIIFGAVVDPVLTGKVKITVIATGFGQPVASKPVGSAAATPAATARLTIARRPLIERDDGAPIGPTSEVAVNALREAAGAADMTLDSGDSNTTGPDFDLSSTFDLPAFLRRQEG
jgi:hypothetical protein